MPRGSARDCASFWMQFIRGAGTALDVRLGESGILEDTFREGGFHDVAVLAVTTRWRFPSTAEVIRAMQDSFPGLQRMMDQLDVSERDMAWTQIERQLSQFEGPNGFEAPGEVLIGVGTK